MVDVNPVPWTERFSIHLPFNYPESIPSAELYQKRQILHLLMHLLV